MLSCEEIAETENNMYRENTLNTVEDFGLVGLESMFAILQIMFVLLKYDLFL